MYKGEDKVLVLISEGQKGKPLSLEDISTASGLNVDSVRRIIESLRTNGYVETKTEEKTSAIPEGTTLKGFVANGFPEIKIAQKTQKSTIPIPISSLSTEERSFGIKWARAKGFVGIEEGKLVPQKTPEEIDQEQVKLFDAAKMIMKNGTCDAEILEEFYERRLVARKVTKKTLVTYTGKTLPQMNESFDVSVASTDAPIGKSHPVTKMSDKMKRIMSEMGFSEMEGSIVESSFWNFDALFQPQDHPARELADTFYLAGEEPLPEDPKLITRVKIAHEAGWRYEWDPKEARKRVLRTHTTALSARNVAAIKDKKPRKFFAVGKVFRNEATDYKHLAEFYQVEGIIAWEGAKFTDLLGTLKEFYLKLGFEKIRFRPSFFPYTEPSLEIEVYYEPRKQWMELGGAGVFRPEVSIPLAGVYPVLAWGLSLERPLMLTLGLDDIRTFYRNDVSFLKSSRLEI